MIPLLAGALGNVLAFLSSSLIPVQPQIAFDLSHLATFAVALTCGLLAKRLRPHFSVPLGIMPFYGVM